MNSPTTTEPTIRDNLNGRDRTSVALSNGPQTVFLSSIADHRPSEEIAPLPPMHFNRVFLEVPWELDPENERNGKIRVLDRRGIIVGTFKNEDVATLIVHLVNRIPADQVTKL